MILDNMFSNGVKRTPQSLLRKALSINAKDNLISFAGGMPSPELFPIKAFERACQDTLKEEPRNSLQYGPSEGLAELREIIAKTYKEKENINVSADNILITNGSQQGLDLIAKVFLNKGDEILIEEPSYLAAIQAFSFYMPKFVPVELSEKGININALRNIVQNANPKIFYTIPNFQNPTGLSISSKTKTEIANVLKEKRTLIIEDDPYAEIRFEGERSKSFWHIGKNSILLGSFSKIVAPGVRVGWIVANNEIIANLRKAKQASDLHTSSFIQHILYRYYRDNDTDKHIKLITQKYGEKKQVMLNALKEHMPAEVKYTNPSGGMFIWITFPKNINSYEIYKKAQKEGVLIIPGRDFYTSLNPPENTARLNFTNSSTDEINTGIKKLAEVYNSVSKYQNSGSKQH